MVCQKFIKFKNLKAVKQNSLINIKYELQLGNDLNLTQK
jgi:hypothetical protein